MRSCQARRCDATGWGSWPGRRQAAGDGRDSASYPASCICPPPAPASPPTQAQAHARGCPSRPSRAEAASDQTDGRNPGIQDHPHPTGNSNHHHLALQHSISVNSTICLSVSRAEAARSEHQWLLCDTAELTLPLRSCLACLPCNSQHTKPSSQWDS